MPLPEGEVNRHLFAIARAADLLSHLDLAELSLTIQGQIDHALANNLPAIDLVAKDDQIQAARRFLVATQRRHDTREFVGDGPAMKRRITRLMDSPQS